MKRPEKIVQLIERFGRLIVNAQHADGFKPVQWESLRYLSQANKFSRNPGSLGEFLGITKGSVSQTVSTLERRGFLRKKSDNADKRIVTLELTAAGRALVANSPLKAVSNSINGLNARQQQELVTSLESMLSQNLNERGRKPFGQCRDCRHLRKKSGSLHCGLLDEPLSAASIESICAEFESAS